MKTVFAALFAVSAVAATSCSGVRSEEVKTAAGVDIIRYMGVWHEIARLPNSFENADLRNTKAAYVLEADGTVRVVNSGVDADGKRRYAEGRAYAPDKSDFSKLRVSFFWPFYGDYYILELAPDYGWALVGGRDKRYLWILARSASLPETTLSEILQLAKKRGYDTSKLVYPRRNVGVEQN